MSLRITAAQEAALAARYGSASEGLRRIVALFTGLPGPGKRG